MKLVNLFLLLLITVLTIPSCSLEKRIHNKGFHVKTTNHSARHPHKLNALEIDFLPVGDQGQRATDHIQGVYSNQEPVHRNTALHHPRAQSEKCDIIIFKDGEERECVVKVITETEVKYARCDNPSGPIYYANKSKVFMIKYANGTKDVFKD